MPSAAPALPTKQTAIVATGPGALAISNDQPVPKLGPKMVIVRTVAVALNPADAKMVDYSPTPGAINGYDFAGEIVAIGAEVTRPDLLVGDRVCGMVHGMNALNPKAGAFAQYIGAEPEFLLNIPDGMSYEAAASLGTGVATAGMALFHYLGILDNPAKPAAKPFFVIVYGASTATGTMAIQLLKLANLRPVAICSPHNFDLVKSYGAEVTFDYNSPTCAEDVRAYTVNTFFYALDCITEASTMAICYGAIGRAGGKYCGLEPYPERQNTRKAVKPDWVMGLSIFGKKVALDGAFGREERPQDREWGVAWFQTLQGLLDGGRLQTHPLQVGVGGFDGVMQGIELLRKKAVSGQKLVYSVQ
ncbi:hypothetical protein KVR01_013856 [Diaporthe batatas]|uniref:uncharacterized protein n=1 Tax=Diaporthe batatas TaxID=748121 RepID=UPI001D03EB5C|nr:uncharacterized protein KVR01_013856 [Diaporthe batatas]KAG8156277.1 hypothetical protein KVR01_013856 [Diaporthe batatas]